MELATLLVTIALTVSTIAYTVAARRQAVEAVKVRLATEAQVDESRQAREAAITPYLRVGFQNLMGANVVPFVVNAGPGWGIDVAITLRFEHANDANMAALVRLQLPVLAPGTEIPLKPPGDNVSLEALALWGAIELTWSGSDVAAKPRRGEDRVDVARFLDQHFERVLDPEPPLNRIATAVEEIADRPTR